MTQATDQHASQATETNNQFAGVYCCLDDSPLHKEYKVKEYKVTALGAWDALDLDADTRVHPQPPKNERAFAGLLSHGLFSQVQEGVLYLTPELSCWAHANGYLWWEATGKGKRPVLLMKHEEVQSVFARMAHVDAYHFGLKHTIKFKAETVAEEEKIAASLNLVMERHASWVRCQGGHMKSPLEIYGLLASEVFEYFAAKSRQDKAEEAADVMLRTLDFIYLLGSRQDKGPWRDQDSRPHTKHRWNLAVYSCMENLANSLRSGVSENTLWFLQDLLYLFEAAPAFAELGVTAVDVLVYKCVKNNWRGSRGRKL